MSPTEPHIYLNLDDIPSLFSDEFPSRASQTQWHDSCRRVHPFVFSAKHYFKGSKDTRGQVYKKQSTNFIILSLQRHEPLHPQNISFKKQEKLIFDGRTPTGATEKVLIKWHKGYRQYRIKDVIKHCEMIWWADETRSRSLYMKEKGDAAVRVVLKTQELQLRRCLWPNRRGKLQYSTVSAL